MAISPELFKVDNVKKIAEAEAWVDAALKRCTNNGSNTFYISTPPGFPYGLMELLLERYRAVGWKEVRYHSDQRDGDAISFRM